MGWTRTSLLRSCIEPGSTPLQGRACRKGSDSSYVWRQQAERRHPMCYSRKTISQDPTFVRFKNHLRRMASLCDFV
eukprot:5430214-Amphidinium_carterae.2